MKQKNVSTDRVSTARPRSAMALLATLLFFATASGARGAPNLRTVILDQNGPSTSVPLLTNETVSQEEVDEGCARRTDPFDGHVLPLTDRPRSPDVC